MSTNATVQESVSNVPNEGDAAKQRALELLKSVSTGRKSVQRVIEHLEGDRPADRLKGSDWLNSVNMVRRHGDGDIVLYNEGDNGATVISRSQYGAIERVDWTVDGGRRHQYESYDIASDYLHKTSWTVLPADGVLERFNSHCKRLAENGGDA